MHTPVTAQITLPNFCWFMFRGDSAYMEAVVCRVTTPQLKKLTFSMPRFLQL